MKPLYALVFELLLGAVAIGQTTPAIIMRTGMAVNSTFIFSLTASSNNTPMQVDFGNGTILNFIIRKAETIISGTLGNSGIIQIYGNGIIALDCSLNQLTALDVSNCPDIKELDCHGNQLNALNLSNNYALEYLACQDNRIAKLDLTNNPKLYSLYCKMNKLSALNVTRNKALIDLSCENNQITTLKISHNNKLELVSCQHNRLTFVTLPVPQSSWLYLYVPQQAIFIEKKYKVGDAVNLCKQSLINGKYTIYTWKTKTGTTLVEGTDYTIKNGISTFKQAQADIVYCQMTNPSFPMFKQNNILRTSYSRIEAS